MTVTVIGMWEANWMDAERSERRLWKQTIDAYDVDVWAMCPANQYVFTSPAQFPTMQAALDAHPGPKTFLIRPGILPSVVPPVIPAIEQGLPAYQHPADAIYCFGNSNEHLGNYVTISDHVVSINTPVNSAFFGCCALTAVLYDRSAKA